MSRKVTTTISMSPELVERLERLLDKVKKNDDQVKNKLFGSTKSSMEGVLPVSEFTTWYDNSNWPESKRSYTLEHMVKVFEHMGWDRRILDSAVKEARWRVDRAYTREWTVNRLIVDLLPIALQEIEKVKDSESKGSAKSNQGKAANQSTKSQRRQTNGRGRPSVKPQSTAKSKGGRIPDTVLQPQG